MFRTLIAAGLGLVALVATSLALADDGGPRLHGPLAGVVRSAQSLELTAEQTAELDDVIAAFPAHQPGMRGPRGDGPPTEEERAAFHATREAHRALLVKQLASDAPSAEALHAMVDGGPRGEAPQEVHDAVDALLAFHATLTPEQRTQLVANLEQRMERRGEGHRHGRRHGPRGDGDCPCSDAP